MSFSDLLNGLDHHFGLPLLLPFGSVVFCPSGSWGCIPFFLWAWVAFWGCSFWCLFFFRGCSFSFLWCGRWCLFFFGTQRSRAWCRTPPILGVVNMVGTRNFTCYMGAL